MGTLTPRLGLKSPVAADNFVTADLAFNWSALDAAPGVHICTSTTRPTWVSAHAGRLIFETDTNLVWRWSGSAWARLGPSGLLATTTRTTDFSTTATTNQTVLSLPVTMPAGGRSVRVVANIGRLSISSSSHTATLVLLRDATVLREWPTVSATATNVFHLCWDLPDTPAAGSRTYSLALRSSNAAGTAQVYATTLAPITLDVTEL